ncbi:competence/damage-inducible protein A [Pleomorphomonas sp. PLEO]|uniref:competence/damage-inducible protein A n=1 Tax=Pleomorphomonas sp. PLEO TaxID=3239306 RepID=UPI00351EBA81
MIAQSPSAAVLIIGDEILSGRTRDSNSGHIAAFLTEIGVDLKEIRVVPDEEDRIVAALDALRAAYTYVFTTGGIGPTHDDITADAVAKAFGVAVEYHPDAVDILRQHYVAPEELTEARMRMARIPVGATLIDNPVSKAPGFHIGNVFVMAGVPKIMQAMLLGIEKELEGGVPVQSITVDCPFGEGVIGTALGEVAKAHPLVSIGSYPILAARNFSTKLVIRSREPSALAAAKMAVEAMLATIAHDKAGDSTLTDY